MSLKQGDALIKLRVKSLKTIGAMKAKKPQRPRCHNCKFASNQFKVGDMTHVHCAGPHYPDPEDTDADNYPSPWETLREFWQTCENHQFKEPEGDPEGKAEMKRILLAEAGDIL